MVPWFSTTPVTEPVPLSVPVDLTSKLGAGVEMGGSPNGGPGTRMIEPSLRRLPPILTEGPASDIEPVLTTVLPAAVLKVERKSLSNEPELLKVPPLRTANPPPSELTIAPVLLRTPPLPI